MPGLRGAVSIAFSMPSGEGGWSPMEGTPIFVASCERSRHFAELVCCEAQCFTGARSIGILDNAENGMEVWGWRMTCVIGAFEGSARVRSIRWLGLASYSNYLEIVCIHFIEFLYFLSHSWGLRLQWLRRRALGSIPVCSWQQIGRLLFVEFLKHVRHRSFLACCQFLRGPETVFGGKFESKIQGAWWCRGNWACKHVRWWPLYSVLCRHLTEH